MSYRIGQGIDIHQFSAGRKLILAGVEVPYEFGLLGHSDADVVLHAVTDALLGAAGLSDIGSYFPDTDAKYKDQESSLFVDKALSLISEKGYHVVNIDITLLLEQPKIAPYVLEMKKNISKLLKIEISDCSIKATTSEKIGFVGRKEGAYASAVVLIAK